MNPYEGYTPIPREDYIKSLLIRAVYSLEDYLLNGALSAKTSEIIKLIDELEKAAE